MLEGKETKMGDFQRIENDDHCTEGRRKVYSDLVDCPTQLICTWVFTCVLHVFHDKARRTQQGNLLTLILIILITMICYDQLKDPDEGVSNWDNR